MPAVRHNTEQQRFELDTTAGLAVQRQYGRSEGCCGAGDWSKAEQALLDVQERSARLLRELGLQGGSAEPPDESSRP